MSSRRNPSWNCSSNCKPVENVTVQLTMEKSLRAQTDSERLQFAEYRADGALERRELRTSRQGREMTLSVRAFRSPACVNCAWTDDRRSRFPA